MLFDNDIFVIFHSYPVPALSEIFNEIFSWDLLSSSIPLVTYVSYVFVILQSNWRWGIASECEWEMKRQC